MNVQCPKCAESFDVPDDSPKCSCPRCGQLIEFADAVPEQYPQQIVKMPTGNPENAGIGQAIMIFIAGVLCVVFFFNGCGVDLDKESPAPWFICGLLCALFISIEKIRVELIRNRPKKS